MYEQPIQNNLPKEEAKEEKKSPRKDFQETTNENMDDSFKKLEKKLTDSIELGRKAGRLLNELNKKSLWMKEKDYFYEDKENFSLKNKINLIETVKNDTERKSSETQACQLITEINFEELRVPTRELENGNQFTKFQYKQDGGENIISEELINVAKESYNLTSANLLIGNKKTGLIIELDQLLPSRYCFAADKMNPKKKIIRDGEIYSKREKYDLNNYEGMQSLSDSEFYCLPRSREISYGDLTKKGGILSILHEISHAWQNVYHDDISAKAKYKNSYNQARTLLEYYYTLNNFLEKKQNDNELSTIKKEEAERAMSTIKEELKKIDIEVNYDNFANPEKKTGNEKIIIKSNEYQKEFEVKSKKMEELLKNYQFEERNAWAHAIELLRFFRKNGIDIEPELKTSADIEKIINTSLESYQNIIDQEIELDKKFKFLKK